MSTHYPPEKVIEKAAEYFEGLGLEITQRDDSSACFEGVDGHVTLSARVGEQTEVDIFTEEWDYQVKEFIQRIGE